jgi:two-component system, OmpR family, sensor kinase
MTRALSHIDRRRSVRTQLAMGSLFFFVIVFLLGSFGIASLRHVNSLQAEIRTRWLPSTSVVGDLNNFTSDFPAAERAALLSSNPNEVAVHAAEMADLDRAIARAQVSYERLRHDPVETELYRRFSTGWQGYRHIVAQELALLDAGHAGDALSLYRSSSSPGYNAASDTLGLLTSRTVTGARDASIRADAAFRESEMLIVIAMLCAGMLTALALFLVRTRISNPLLNLSVCIRRLANHDMDVDIPGRNRSDEIGDMARAIVKFRENAIDLATSRRWLSQQAAMLEEKLADGRRVALQQRNFVSMASHEFRTPLTSIDAHAQRLLKIKNRIADSEFAERIGKIRKAVLRLTNLINNMIETSRVDERNAELYFHPAELDLRDVLAEVCQFHQEIAPRQIIESYDAESLVVAADAKLLFQVFSNILSNAIKYSPPESPIEIGAHPDRGAVVVSIGDRGMGIPARDIPSLFQRFYRGSNTANTVGTGIGLFFVKTVVDLHGGEISVASTEGAGTTITVRLPVRPPVSLTQQGSIEPAVAA